MALSHSISHMPPILLPNKQKWHSLLASAFTLLPLCFLLFVYTLYIPGSTELGQVLDRQDWHVLMLPSQIGFQHPFSPSLLLLTVCPSLSVSCSCLPCPTSLWPYRLPIFSSPVPLSPSLSLLSCPNCCMPGHHGTALLPAHMEQEEGQQKSASMPLSHTYISEQKAAKTWQKGRSKKKKGTCSSSGAPAAAGMAAPSPGLLPSH